jgi:hypothetical protein
MTIKENILAVYKRKNDYKIPWAVYGGFLLPTGTLERQLRNRGCGWIQWEPVCSWQPPGMGHMNGWMYESEIKNAEMSLKIIWRNNQKIFRRTYSTPIGDVYEELHEEPGYRSLWVKKYFIEKPRDYEIVKYLVENSVLRENYGKFLESRDNLGDDGVLLAVIDRSPFQKMLIEICGTERLMFDLIDIPEIVEDLMQTIQRKQEEAFQIIANSPAEVIWMVDNLTGDITEPRLFKKYCIPFYNNFSKYLHEHNKVIAVHLDGKLMSIKKLLNNTDIDVIESFTLPDMGGDITIEEASKLWKDKSIIANIPAFLCYEEEKIIKKYLYDLLEKIYPRKNFMLELSENLPQKYLKKVLPIVAEVMENQ